MVYLVESYRPVASARSARSIRRVRAGVESRAVRLRARLVVPSDETEYWVVEAASMVEVATAAAALGIGGSRISEVAELRFFGPIDPDPAVEPTHRVAFGGGA